MPQRHQAAINEEATTLVVECSDRSYRKAFLEFRLKSLGLTEGEFYVLKVLGGAAWLARPEEFKARYDIMVEDILWVCEQCPTINRIILKNHHNCLFYKHRVSNPDHDTELARRDVPIAYRNLRPLVPERIKIETYYARIINSQGVVDFEKIFTFTEEEAETLLKEKNGTPNLRPTQFSLGEQWASSP